MDKNINIKYNEKAIDLLNDKLINCPWNIDNESKIIDKKKLLEMFDYSCQMMQKNEKYDAAEDVFELCVRVVRCLCMEEYEASKILVNDKVYCFGAFVHYETAIKCYESIKE